MKPKRISILGATGSIGTSTLSVLEQTNEFDIFALTAHKRAKELGLLCERYRPRYAVLGSGDAARDLAMTLAAKGIATEVLVGEEGLKRVASHSEVSHVMAAIVGGGGLAPTFAAAESGKTVLLANKEALVMAGSIFMSAIAASGAQLLPVDSEHNAIFQCLGQTAAVGADVSRILLTGSGGPFLQTPLADLAQVTPEDACRHPNWDMGRKISVDSATMMNKALEIVEARWLFDLDPRQIEVVVHPQSIIHSMVEFIDGSIIAQMSPPDMKLPIQYALTWPHRQPSCGRKLSFDEELGMEAARLGGTSGVVLNAANETAVAGFLENQIKFNDIVPACRSVFDQHPFEATPSLNGLLKLDRWAREEVSRWICT